MCLGYLAGRGAVQSVACAASGDSLQVVVAATVHRQRMDDGRARRVREGRMQRLADPQCQRQIIPEHRDFKPKACQQI
jgi:hypothetical protein